jgi:hypothetical protein
MNDIDYIYWCQKQKELALKEEQKEAISELEKDASYKEQKALMFEQAEKEFKKTLSKEIIEEVGYYNALVNNIKENDAGRK